MSRFVPRPKTARERVQRALRHPVFDLLVVALIVASVALLVIDYTYPLTDRDEHLLTVVDLVISGLFAIELALRFWVARRKRRFFYRYWPDLLALLPVLRPFRFLRLLRLLRLFRVGMILARRVTSFYGLVRINLYELWALIVITLIVVAGAGVLMFVFEVGGASDFETLRGSLRWSLLSLIASEPIGGLPATLGGQTVLLVVMLAGMMLFAVFTGVVSATMIDRLSGRERVWEMDIDELEGHVVLCGWNAGIPALIAELARDEELAGVPVVLVNELPEAPDLSASGKRSDLLYFVRGDHTKLDVLSRAGVTRATRAVVMADALHTDQLSDRDARSVLAALTIEKLNPSIYCVVELMDPTNEGHLRMAGVEAMVMRNDLSGQVIATACRHPELVNVLMELTTLTRGATLARKPGPREPTPFGVLTRSLVGVLPIGIERAGEGVRLNPGPDAVVFPGDWLMVIE